jgi:hypothetical protein
MIKQKNLIFIFLILFHIKVMSQTDTATFNPKQELVYDGKRYRVYNNWLSIGGGAGYNSSWIKDERNLGIDYSFNIKKIYYRAGAFMSGRNFTESNNYNFHAAIGIRKEHTKYNLSAFAGPSTAYFKRPLKDSVNYNLKSVYNEVGLYACLEAVYKVKYDVGLGGQIFCDVNRVQLVYGVRLIAYFSGAYRGVKYGYKAPAKK